MSMPSPSAGWFGATASGGAAFTDVRGVPGPLPSPQYGPAWVADHTTHSTHADRRQAVVDNDPELADHLGDDPDAIAVAYARILVRLTS